LVFTSTLIISGGFFFVVPLNSFGGFSSIMFERPGITLYGGIGAILLRVWYAYAGATTLV
jgi:hypothetical protein